MPQFKRYTEDQIRNNLNEGRALIIYGSRRTGKTTICRNILQDYGKEGRYLNCENFLDRGLIENPNIDTVINLLREYKVVVIDEAQTIPRIGFILKLIYDTMQERSIDTQIIATGSSSFDLANKIGEPLVGRAFWRTMYSLSIAEISEEFDDLQLQSKLEGILRFGLMPDIFNSSEDKAIAKLNELVSAYLYKDILAVEGIQKSSLVENILKALAHQVGSTVSIRELAQIVSSTPATVEKYLNILENCFVIFSLGSLSRNPRNEIKKNKKYYFWDIGVRNAIIQNFNKIEDRNDIGAIWENFCIVERIKYMSKINQSCNRYFWRSLAQQEIDYIEEYGGKLVTWECKYSPKKQVKTPTEFTKTYTDYEFKVINSENWLENLK